MSGLDKNRKRNQTICFRMSPEERCQLQARILVSGMPKGQYFIESLLHQEIHIKAGKYQSDRLSLELRKLRKAVETTSYYENENFTLLLGDCKELLEQLLFVVTQVNSTEIQTGNILMDKK